MRLALCVCFCVLVGACGSSYKLSSNSPPEKLANAGSAYVGLPRDGQYGSTVYVGSGFQTANSITGALLKRLSNVEQATQVEARDTGIENARSRGLDYYVQSQIINWEDRATEWSGKPDRIEIFIKIIDVEADKLIDQCAIVAQSSWWTLGGDHPQDLLNDPVEQYFFNLF